MKATRADVARIAKVSTTTVSYVLNKSKPISAETTERVLRAVEQLGYRPDFIAKTMTTKESMQLGVYVENIGNPFFGDIIKGFENKANIYGYFVSVFTNAERASEYFENAIARRLDGMFLMAVPTNIETPWIDRLVDHEISVVVSGYGNTVDARRVSAIENDYMTGMRDAMTCLYNHGHREIAHLTGLPRKSRFDVRADAYVKCVEQMKLPVGDDLLVTGNPPYTTTWQDGYNLMKSLLNSGRRFTAVVCVNDLMAYGAYMALSERRLRVPEDVAVVGFDNLEFSQLCNPPLSTVGIDKYALGEKAFDLLYTDITKKTTGFFLNPMKLIERQSTAVYRTYEEPKLL